MRAAAGVDVGDTVDLSLRAVGADAASTPADLRAALQAARTLAAYGRLAPSHRRELVRWIDDARTASNRKTRIDDTVAQVRDGEAPRRGRKADKPLWICPKCGHAFVSRNIFHSCRRLELGHPFRAKPPEIRRLFDRFRALVESNGPVRLIPYENRVGFMVQVRFAGATPRKGWLDVSFWLTKRLEGPRFRRVETISPRAHIHTVRITEPSQLDSELAGWIREAYAIGCRRHLSA
jgi:hypothetical protein